MSESKKDWKVVDGYYPGFLNIVGASYTVSIVTSATDLTLEDYVNRTNDAHLMAAAPKLLKALEKLVRNGQKQGWGDNYESDMNYAYDAISAARGAK